MTDPSPDEMAHLDPADPIDIREATVATAQITIETLKIGRKQVTLAVFRQLRSESVVDPLTTELLGPVWGRITYHPDKCADDGEHIHLVWQKGDQLRRATMPRARPWRDGIQVDLQSEQQATTRLNRRGSLDALIRHLLDGWVPQKRSYVWADTAITYDGLTHQALLPLDSQRRSDLTEPLVELFDRLDRLDRPRHDRERAAEYRKEAASAPLCRPAPTVDASGYERQSYVRTRDDLLQSADAADASADEADASLLAARRTVCRLACRSLGLLLRGASSCAQPDTDEHDPSDCTPHLAADRPALLAALAAADRSLVEAEQRHERRDRDWDETYQRLSSARHLFIAV